MYELIGVFVFLKFLTYEVTTTGHYFDIQSFMVFPVALLVECIKASAFFIELICISDQD